MEMISIASTAGDIYSVEGLSETDSSQNLKPFGESPGEIRFWIYLGT